ncbi:MAG: O-antigen ligase family protein, partial [Pseudomonadota bacterium]
LATLRGPAFTGLTIILCCLVASGLVAVWSLDIALIEDGLAALGKTSTLTGRTLLWEIAMNRAQDRPLLGVGYMAYWSAPEFAQDVSIINGLYGATVEAFHNVFLETLVMLGPFGVVSMAALIGFSMRAIWRAPKGSLRTWALALFAVLIFSAMLGSSLYRPHELTLLMVVALAAACAAASEAALPVARSSETTPRPMPPKVQS